MKKLTTKQKVFNTKKANKGHIKKAQRRRHNTAIRLQQEKMEKLYRRGFVPYTPPVVEEPVETKENKKSDDETLTL